MDLIKRYPVPGLKKTKPGRPGTSLKKDELTFDHAKVVKPKPEDWAGHTYENIPMFDIMNKYHRTHQRRHRTLSQVCDTLGLDYYDLCKHLRQNFSLEKINLYYCDHEEALSARRSELLGDYMCDYMMISPYHYTAIAVMFGLSCPSQVERAIKKSKTYAENMPNRRVKRDLLFPAPVYISLTPEAAKLQLTTPEYNSMLWKACETELPPIKSPVRHKAQKIEVYHPIIERVTDYINGFPNATICDLMDSAILKYRLSRKISY
jgi:hypothetical protein